MKRQICFTLRPGVSWENLQGALAGGSAFFLEHSVTFSEFAGPINQNRYHTLFGSG